MIIKNFKPYFKLNDDNCRKNEILLNKFDNTFFEKEKGYYSKLTNLSNISRKTKEIIEFFVDLLEENDLSLLEKSTTNNSISFKNQLLEVYSNKYPIYELKDIRNELVGFSLSINIKDEIDSLKWNYEIFKELDKFFIDKKTNKFLDWIKKNPIMMNFISSLVGIGRIFRNLIFTKTQKNFDPPFVIKEKMCKAWPYNAKELIVNNCLQKAKERSNEGHGKPILNYLNPSEMLSESHRRGRQFEEKIKNKLMSKLRNIKGLQINPQLTITSKNRCDFLLAWQDIYGNTRSIILECKHSDAEEVADTWPRIREGMNQLVRYKESTKMIIDWKIDLLVVLTDFSLFCKYPATFEEDILILNANSMLDIFIEAFICWHQYTTTTPLNNQN